MKKLLTVFGLLATVVTLPTLASDADREGKREQAKKEMRAMDDKQVQERRTMEDECHGKMKSMREKHQKERESLKEKHGLDKDGKKPRPPSGKP